MKKYIFLEYMQDFVLKSKIFFAKVLWILMHDCRHVAWWVFMSSCIASRIEVHDWSLFVLKKLQSIFNLGSKLKKKKRQQVIIDYFKVQVHNICNTTFRVWCVTYTGFKSKTRPYLSHNCVNIIRTTQQTFRNLNVLKYFLNDQIQYLQNISVWYKVLQYDTIWKIHEAIIHTKDITDSALWWQYWSYTIDNVSGLPFQW